MLWLIWDRIDSSPSSDNTVCINIMNHIAYLLQHGNFWLLSPFFLRSWCQLPRAVWRQPYCRNMVTVWLVSFIGIVITVGSWRNISFINYDYLDCESCQQIEWHCVIIISSPRFEPARRWQWPHYGLCTMDYDTLSILCCTIHHQYCRSSGEP